MVANSLLYLLLATGLTTPPEESVTTESNFAVQKCGENQHFNRCGTDCPLTCENFENPPTSCNKLCRIGCECEKGFVRRADGKCVRTEQCPKIQVQKCGENQHFNRCGTDCPLTCENFENPPTSCNKMCRIGCECDKGFVRRADRKCVRTEQCPKTQGFDAARRPTYPTRPPRNQYTAPPVTEDAFTRYIDPDDSEAQWRTRSYEDDTEDSMKFWTEESEYRTEDPDDQFTAPPGKKRDKCPANEHHTMCGARCQITCDNYKKPFPCEMVCLPGCVCDEGLIRGPDGKCIKKEKCPEKPNAEVQRRPTYPTRPPRHQDTIPPVTEDAVTRYIDPNDAEAQWRTRSYEDDTEDSMKFWTEESEYRTEDPDDEFTAPLGRKQIKCPANEQRTICDAYCQRTCDNYKKPTPCPLVCVPGCICEDGLVRGPDKKCIKPESCPAKPNAEVQRRPTYPTRPPRHQETIPPVTEAGDSCRANEHHSVCGARCQANCDNYKKPIPCPMICTPGCICDFGYIRGPDGKCIKPANCPAKPNAEAQRRCPRNEHLSMCGARCQPNCDTYEKPIPCEMICTKGCICDEGYIRGPDKKCIKPKKCPAKPNAEAQRRRIYPTEEPPRHQYTAPPVTEDAFTRYIDPDDAEAQWRTHWDEEGTEDSWKVWTEESEYRTEDPDENAENYLPLATEEPEDETDRPEALPKRKHHKRTCPPREHLARYNDITCSNYKNWKPVPKKGKRTCVCDTGVVRNKEGKCVPPKECEKQQMAEANQSDNCHAEYDCRIYCALYGKRGGRCEGDACVCEDRQMAESDESHGCPYEFSCDVYCITSGKKGGKCKGNICECFGR